MIYLSLIWFTSVMTVNSLKRSNKYGDALSDRSYDSSSGSDILSFDSEKIEENSTGIDYHLHYVPAFLNNETDFDNVQNTIDISPEIHIRCKNEENCCNNMFKVVDEGYKQNKPLRLDPERTCGDFKYACLSYYERRPSEGRRCSSNKLFKLKNTMPCKSDCEKGLKKPKIETSNIEYKYKNKEIIWSGVFVGKLGKCFKSVTLCYGLGPFFGVVPGEDQKKFCDNKWKSKTITPWLNGTTEPFGVNVCGDQVSTFWNFIYDDAINFKNVFKQLPKDLLPECDTPPKLMTIILIISSCLLGAGFIFTMFWCWSWQRRQNPSGDDKASTADVGVEANSTT